MMQKIETKHQPQNELDFESENESESESDTELEIEPDIEFDNQNTKLNSNNKLLSSKIVTDYLFANANDYHFKSWEKTFPDSQVKLRSLLLNPAWNQFFDIIQRKPYFKNMEKILSDYLKKKEHTILPHAELVFNSFNVLSPNKIKVVILGQDPYIGINKINNQGIPQAMGFSFSVPLNYPKPVSLTNIYQNLVDFGHAEKKPESGCLATWIMQGCFLINSAFTTFLGKSNAHKDLWMEFTKDLLKYLNDKCNHLVFLAWGGNAHRLCLLIDPEKHRIITSSHPSSMQNAYMNQLSGLSYGKERKQVVYPSFKSLDHFGRTNEYLKSIGKTPIIWDLIDL